VREKTKQEMGHQNENRRCLLQTEEKDVAQ
jgi:hypothetical protein